MIPKRTHLFTSESVTEGHPDKMADQIADAVLDSFLAQDKDSKVAIECLLKTGLCLLAGEVRTNAKVDFYQIARECIKEIGYNSQELGFDYNTCSVLLGIENQSGDIARGVDEAPGKSKAQVIKG